MYHIYKFEDESLNFLKKTETKLEAQKEVGKLIRVDVFGDSVVYNNKTRGSHDEMFEVVGGKYGTYYLADSRDEEELLQWVDYLWDY